MTDEDNDFEVEDPREVRARAGEPKRKGFTSEGAKAAAAKSAEVRKAKAEARARGEVLEPPKGEAANAPAFVAELRKQFEANPELIAKASLESATSGKSSSGLSQLLALAFPETMSDSPIPRSEAAIRAMSNAERRALLRTLERRGCSLPPAEEIEAELENV